MGDPLLTSVAVVVGVVAVVLLALFLLWRMMWRVAEPNEALVISGLHQGAPNGVGESLGFKIVTGKGTLVLPGVQMVRRLSLDLRETDLQVDCVSQQGIPLKIRAVVIYKVGDDYASIANAARRFLDQQNQMDQRVHNVFAGHLRAIVGNMTVEEMIRDREKLTQLTREHAGTEMEKLGLIIDSLQVQEIDDPTGYIKNMARPHAVAIEREARIAQAGADREATQKEQEADALKAQARRDSQIKQAGYQAEIDQATALAKQAGPLSEATNRQRVVVEETKVAELEAQRAEQRLYVEVRKPADAKAYQEVTLAKAERDAAIAAAEARAREVELAAAAEAGKTKTIAAADAERVDALAENQDAVIGQQLAERWPEIVEAAAKPFGDIDQLIVLNGAKGLSETLAQALSQGATGLDLARQLLAGKNGKRSNGAVHAETETVAASETPASDRYLTL